MGMLIGTMFEFMNEHENVARSPRGPLVLAVVGTTSSGASICRYVAAGSDGASFAAPREPERGSTKPLSKPTPAARARTRAEQLGRRLRELRMESDLDFAEIGEMLGFATNILGYWERGLYLPAKAQIRALATYFGVTERQMCGLDPLPPLG